MLHVTPLGLGKVFSVSRKETTGSLSGVPILDRSYVDFQDMIMKVLIISVSFLKTYFCILIVKQEIDIGS